MAAAWLLALSIGCQSGDGATGEAIPPTDGAAAVADSGHVGDSSADAGATPDATSFVDGGPPMHDAGSGADAQDAARDDAGRDSSTGGGPITCPGPGSYKNNGVGCGIERWDIKVGTDPAAPSVKLVPVPTTIAQLVAIPAAGGGASRSSPVEDTLYELRDVKMSLIKGETDSDYHIVVTDGPHTMIVEIPFPGCVVSPSPWECFVSRARGAIDAQFSVSSSPQYPNITVSLRGVGFFDVSHNQTGVAPNAIELHPVLELCIGAGCTLQ